MMPKKEGISVIQNEKNEFIPTRTAHVKDFYCRFIKDISKIAKLLTNLLVKDTSLLFDKKCGKAFETLKNKLVSTPIMISSDWSRPFEIRCDASDIAVREVLGQRREKILHMIYYASHVLNLAHMNYATLENNY